MLIMTGGDLSLTRSKSFVEHLEYHGRLFGRYETRFKLHFTSFW